VALFLSMSRAENRDKRNAISRQVRSSAVQLATCEGAVLCNTPVDNTNRFTLRMQLCVGGNYVFNGKNSNFLL